MGSSDTALPGKHTRTLYGRLKRSEAALLVQLRTGHTGLNSYVQMVRLIDSNWNHLRGEITEAMGAKYGDLSYALGDRSSETLPDGQPVDKPESWKPNLTVVRAIPRFVVSTGRLGNATERGLHAAFGRKKPEEYYYYHRTARPNRELCDHLLYQSIP
ncbi:hypothetical protein BDV29DRAFT_159050 [Aspergillus leporis]|uniref:Uncharacterized protein n=1 Tax=Aspergillus leporis TaxID=41062 RepID=A0A5N5WX97_9EURO|nr:hypothetical protein BDV29DRAFT_159050 [Aspergillus leporis]